MHRTVATRLPVSLRTCRPETLAREFEEFGLRLSRVELTPKSATPVRTIALCIYCNISMHCNNWTMGRHIDTKRHRQRIAKLLNTTDKGGIMCSDCGQRILSARTDSLNRHKASPICSKRRDWNLSRISQTPKSVSQDDKTAKVSLPLHRRKTSVDYTNPRSARSKLSTISRSVARAVSVVSSMAEQERARSTLKEGRHDPVPTDRYGLTTIAPLVLPANEEFRTEAIQRLPSIKSFDREDLDMRMTNLPPQDVLKMLRETEFYDPIPRQTRTSDGSHSKTAFKPYKRPRMATRVE